MKKLLVLFLLLLIYSTAKTKTVKDSIRVYQLGDINVIGIAPKEKISLSDIESVKFKTLQTSDVQSFSGLQLYMPSARIKTNSRGESLLFLRNAGERQIGLFFDGVPLNIAWDNRFDLSLLPTDIVGEININKSGNSILYGPNILGGAINISSFERANEGFGGVLRLQGGEAGMYQGSLTHDGKIGKLNYLAAVSYFNTNGYLLSNDVPDTLTNQNFNSSMRTNTDRTFLSLYGRAEYQFSSKNKIGISVLNINGEKGVAPESDVEPADARFWRYPDWKRTMIAANVQTQLSEKNSLFMRGTLWYDLFNQTINSYTGISYQDIESFQKDDDNTLGARLNFAWNINASNILALVFNWSNSSHNESITDFTNNQSEGVKEEKFFSQNLLSTGVDYQFKHKSFSIRSGALFDYFATGDAGPYSEAAGSSISDYGLYMNLNVNVAATSFIFVNLSRRTRFPTLRESYSGALGKFKVNTNLQPETGILSEIGINHKSDIWIFETDLFANFYDDLITKIKLTEEEDSLRRYMRVNFSSVTIYGFEFTLGIMPFTNFSCKANFTYMKSEGEQLGSTLPYIENKPNILSGIVLEYHFDFGLGIQLESETVGVQYQRNPNNKNEYIKIGGTTIFNGRLAYNLPFFDNASTQFYIRLNNIADTYRLYQLGLPEPGRMLRGGIMLNF